MVGLAVGGAVAVVFGLVVDHDLSSNRLFEIGRRREQLCLGGVVVFGVGANCGAHGGRETSFGIGHCGTSQNTVGRDRRFEVHLAELDSRASERTVSRDVGVDARGRVADLVVDVGNRAVHLRVRVGLDLVDRCRQRCIHLRVRVGFHLVDRRGQFGLLIGADGHDAVLEVLGRRAALRPVEPETHQKSQTNAGDHERRDGQTMDAARSRLLLHDQGLDLRLRLRLGLRVVRLRRGLGQRAVPQGRRRREGDQLTRKRNDRVTARVVRADIRIRGQERIAKWAIHDEILQTHFVLTQTYFIPSIVSLCGFTTGYLQRFGASRVV